MFISVKNKKTDEFVYNKDVSLKHIDDYEIITKNKENQYINIDTLSKDELLKLMKQQFVKSKIRDYHLENSKISNAILLRSDTEKSTKIRKLNKTITQLAIKLYGKTN
mgnify:CR=1 FL=1